jgi:hypothetical protein
MRFVRLAVESFQAVDRAEVDFGPGLNVLYGPNDLGKSTLATAIRAALLVPPGSAGTDAFLPWHADASPVVSLTFLDDLDRHWKVTKRFGKGTSGSAELRYSKDGVVFSVDCKGRQVEEKVRAMLEWGIPGPGGKGGSRGLPVSFLATALLGGQGNVDAILGASLDKDLDVSGKLRLTRALAALAQDPLFKEVLDSVQGTVDASFTPTGQRKRGQGSTFTKAADMVKAFKDELGALQRQVDDSSGIEEKVNLFRGLCENAALRVEETARKLAVIVRGVENALARETARNLLETAVLALNEIQSLASEAQQLTAKVEGLTEREKAQELEIGAAGTRFESAQAKLAASNEELRLANSEDGAAQREVLRAQLAEKLAALNLRRQMKENQRAKVDAALKLRSEAIATQAAVPAAGEQLTMLEGTARKLAEQVAAAEVEVETASAVVAYGRWRVAVTEAEEAAEATAAAAGSRMGSDQKEAEAHDCDDRCRTLDDDIASRAAGLATEEQVAAFLLLARDIEFADAALGGGISVSLRPRGAVGVRVKLDDREMVAHSLSADQTLEAERSIHLSVADLLDIEITAGDADRRAVRWRPYAPAGRRRSLRCSNGPGRDRRRTWQRRWRGWRRSGWPPRSFGRMPADCARRQPAFANVRPCTRSTLRVGH